MEKYISLSIFMFTCCLILNGQEDKGQILKGFGIEEGIGYNTLNLKNGQRVDESYQKLFVQPVAKIFYNMSLYRFGNGVKIRMPIFIGYSTFGGKHENTTFLMEPGLAQPTTIIDQFRGLEGGINPSIEKGRVQIGLLFKEQYIFSAMRKMYMVGSSQGSYWMETDERSQYKNYAFSWGIKIKVRIIRGFSLSGETGWGVTNLYGWKHADAIYANNYRLLLGYQF